MSKESWVGFPDVADRTGGEIVIGHTGLPVGLDPEQLQLNTEALRRGVIGWGGYEALILSAYQGDSDQHSLGVGSVDGSGVGMSSMTSTVTRAESSNYSSMNDESYRNWLDFRSGTLAVRWNVNALNGRIRTNEQYDPQIRAKQLNKEIKITTIQAVAVHNTKEVWSGSPSPLPNVVFGGLDAWFIQGLINSAFVNQDVQATGTALVWRAGLMLGLRGLKTMRGVSFNETINDTFLFSCRPTRVALGAGVLASSKLVRAAPTKKEQ